MTQRPRPSRTARTVRDLALSLVLISLFTAVLAPVYRPLPALAAEPDQITQTNPLDPFAVVTEVYNFIRANSVNRPDASQLAHHAIQGMLSGLRDYYAQYYSPEEMASFVSDVTGEFGGIGVRVSADDEGYLLVVEVLRGFAADKAGILVGDRIVGVDGVDIKGEGLRAADKIRGEVGTKVVLTVTRQGQKEPLTFELVRELIKVTTVDYRMLDGQVAYIRLKSFDEDTDEEFDKALQDAAASGAKAIILDLRDNPGGLLDTCLNIADRFLPDGRPILRVNWAWRTETIKAHEREGYTPLAGVPYGPEGSFPYPVAALVNGNSASASEILAAALQDWGVARVFGEKTYGKGSVQSLYGLSDGGGVKVTTATWTSGLGRTIDGAGVEPDETITPYGATLPPEPQPTAPGRTPVTDRWVFRRGSQGSDVVNLQMRLSELGYYSTAADGIFGAATERALKKFQAAAGLPQTGVTDKATVVALNRATPPGSGAGASGTPGGSRPPAKDTWPKVTGDRSIDRALQWLHGQLDSPGH